MDAGEILKWIIDNKTDLLAAGTALGWAIAASVVAYRKAKAADAAGELNLNFAHVIEQSQPLIQAVINSVVSNESLNTHQAAAAAKLPKSVKREMAKRALSPPAAAQLKKVLDTVDTKKVH